jgi:hypothetical protein
MIQSYLVAPIMQLATYLDQSEREFAQGLEKQVTDNQNQGLFEGQEVHQL